MNTKKDQNIFDRREALKMLGIGSTAGIMGMFGSASSPQMHTLTLQSGISEFRNQFV